MCAARFFLSVSILPLDPAGVHLWYHVTSPLDDVDAACGVLDAEERARHGRFRFAEDRRDFAMAHALLRRSLSRYDQRPAPAWTFAADASGKPRLAPAHPSGLTFNLSHTRGLVACAIGRDADVGIDDESVDARVDGQDIARQFFSSREVDALDACPVGERAARFIDLWTLKEAYLKATGAGIAGGLRSVEFHFSGERALRFASREPDGGASWTFALFAPTPGTRMAVAARLSCADRPTITVQPALPALRASIAARG